MFQVLVRGVCYIGDKLHLVSNASGVYRDLMVTAANIHDNAYLKILGEEDMHLSNRIMLVDKGYIGKATQRILFELLGLKIDVPYKCSQRDFTPHDYGNKIARKLLRRSSHSCVMNSISIRTMPRGTTVCLHQLYENYYPKPSSKYANSLAANPSTKPYMLLPPNSSKR